MTIYTREDRIKISNIVLSSFAKNAFISKKDTGFYVNWLIRKDIPISKRWSTKGQDFYPPWSRKWLGGGTSITALSQLIRWIKNKPVLPISTWYYWSSDQILLLPRESVDYLSQNNYPKNAICVLCRNNIEGGLDWWHLDKVSGPCCSWTSGCRQKHPS